MSKLEDHWEYENGPIVMRRKVYYKSDVDAVIAEKDRALEYAKALTLKDIETLKEKDKEIAELKEQVSEERSAKVDYKISANDLSNGLKEAFEEIKHHKFKRCLYMAKWCFTKSNYHFVLARHGEDGKENNRKSILYSKWRSRWLEIAEEFKGSV